MTPGWLDAAIVLAAPSVLGHATLRAIGIDAAADRVAWPAWAYTIGSLVHATLLSLWFALGKPVGGTWVLPAEIVLGLIAIAACRGRAPAPTSPAPRTLGRGLGLLLTVALTVIVIVHLTTGNPTLMMHSDGSNIWTAKARVMFTTAGFGDDYRRAAGLFVIHPDYPLLNPLLQLGAFEQVGALTPAFNRLPIVAFVPALLLAMMAAARRFVPWLAAAAMATMLVGAGSVRAIAFDTYSDIMVMLGLLVTIDAWLRWQASHDPACWRLATLAATFTVSSKNEGAMLLLVVAIAIVTSRLLGGVTRSWPRRLRDRAWLAIPTAAIAGHALLNTVMGFGSDLFEAGADHGSFFDRLTANLAERAPRLLEFFTFDVALDAPATRLVFALMLLAFLLRPHPALRSPATVPLLAAAGGLVAYMLVFAASYWTLDEHLATAGVRVAMHLAPLALLATAMLLGRPDPERTRADRELSPDGPPLE
ncbi:MAG: hypothetical protein KDC98_24375 [Planctomycetes bacterium]|nr:hypothetical protein [Planctomycetota bacterium]